MKDIHHAMFQNALITAIGAVAMTRYGFAHRQGGVVVLASLATFLTIWLGGELLESRRVERELDERLLAALERSTATMLRLKVEVDGYLEQLQKDHGDCATCKAIRQRYGTSHDVS